MTSDNMPVITLFGLQAEEVSSEKVDSWYEIDINKYLDSTGSLGITKVLITYPDGKTFWFSSKLFAKVRSGDRLVVGVMYNDRERAVGLHSRVILMGKVNGEWIDESVGHIFDSYYVSRMCGYYGFDEEQGKDGEDRRLRRLYDRWLMEGTGDLSGKYILLILYTDHRNYISLDLATKYFQKEQPATFTFVEEDNITDYKLIGGPLNDVVRVMERGYGEEHCILQYEFKDRKDGLRIRLTAPVYVPKGAVIQVTDEFVQDILGPVQEEPRRYCDEREVIYCSLRTYHPKDEEDVI